MQEHTICSDAALTQRVLCYSIGYCSRFSMHSMHQEACPVRSVHVHALYLGRELGGAVGGAGSKMEEEGGGGGPIL